MNHHIDFLTESHLHSRVQLRFKQTLFFMVFISILTIPTVRATSNDLPVYCAKALHPILITVHGLRNDRGSIKAKLYGDNPDDFLVSGKKLHTKRESTQRPTTMICLEAPHPGTYAIVVHHDENNNKKLDRNWVGLPKEGVGFSNNPELLLAAPDHEDVTFQVLDSETTLDIQMRY